jgi:hypothetical protein
MPGHGGSSTSATRAPSGAPPECPTTVMAVGSPPYSVAVASANRTAHTAAAVWSKKMSSVLSTGGRSVMTGQDGNTTTAPELATSMASGSMFDRSPSVPWNMTTTGTPSASRDAKMSAVVTSAMATSRVMTTSAVAPASGAGVLGLDWLSVADVPHAANSSDAPSTVARTVLTTQSCEPTPAGSPGAKAPPLGTTRNSGRSPRRRRRAWRRPRPRTRTPGSPVRHQRCPRPRRA